MENEIRLNNFKKDLKALLKKYEAGLSFMVGEGSDTHGLYDEAIGVQFLEPLKKGNRYRGWSDDIALSDGWGCTAGDLDE